MLFHFFAKAKLGLFLDCIAFDSTTQKRNEKNLEKVSHLLLAVLDLKFKLFDL